MPVILCAVFVWLCAMPLSGHAQDTQAPAGGQPEMQPPPGCLFKCDIPYGADSEAQKLDILYPGMFQRNGPLS